MNEADVGGGLVERLKTSTALATTCGEAAALDEEDEDEDEEEVDIDELFMFMEERAHDDDD